MRSECDITLGCFSLLLLLLSLFTFLAIDLFELFNDLQRLANTRI